MKRLLYILTIALLLPSCANHQQQETTYPWEKETEKQEQIRRLDSIYSSDEEQLEINRAQKITNQLFSGDFSD